MRPKSKTPKFRSPQDSTRTPAARRATLDRRSARKGKAAIRKGA
jgi:hypothetical protein